MSENPWHAECRECRAWLVPPRTTLCPSCEEKVNAYANAKIKADQVRGYPYHPSMDTDIFGRTLNEFNREAMHKVNMRKDKDE